MLRSSEESMVLREDLGGRNSGVSPDGSKLDRAGDGLGGLDAPADFATSMPGASLYEKKCMLINREIDAMGMGKYQWFVWGLCGFGYLLDLVWAQAFGLVLSPLEQEFGFSNNESGNISTSFSAGLTAGAAFWGILVDIVGRQWAFNLTVLFASAFGLALGGANSYTTFLVLTAFVGFGVGGNIPIDTTITLEFIPQRSRYLLPFLSIFQPIGVVITTGLAYAFIPGNSCIPDFTEANMLPSCANSPGLSPPQCCGKENNMGWRYLLFTLGGITLAVFLLRFVIFRFKESPKFLVYRGRDRDAVEVLEYINKYNGRSGCGVSLEDFEALERAYATASGVDNEDARSDDLMLGAGAAQLSASWRQKLRLEMQRYKLLFSSFQMGRRTLLVWLIYVCDYWGFTVAGTFLPRILAVKNSAIHLSLRFTYRSYVYIYLPGIVGVLLGTFLYSLPFVGRKYSMAAGATLMGVSLFLFATVNSEASNIGLNVMEYFFQSMFNAVLYGWTPEVFPAPIRGTACGLASFWGRLFGIVSPLIANSLLPTGSDALLGSAYNPVLYMAGGVTLGATVFILLLPNSIVDAESM